MIWGKSPSLPRLQLPLYKRKVLKVSVSRSVMLTLCNPTDCSPPGSSVHGILQARILEWVAMPFGRWSSQPRDRTWVSHTEGRFFTIWATRKVPSTREDKPIFRLWILSFWDISDIMHFLCAAKSLQSCPTLCNPIDGSPPGSPSLGFSRQEHWSGLPFPSPMRESEKWKWRRLVVSDSSRPHGLQPTRLLCPWHFPGKRTNAGDSRTPFNWEKLLKIYTN